MPCGAVVPQTIYRYRSARQTIGQSRWWTAHRLPLMLCLHADVPIATNMVHELISSMVRVSNKLNFFLMHVI